METTTLYWGNLHFHEGTKMGYIRIIAYILVYKFIGIM